MDCTKVFKPGDPPTHLHTFVAGEAFGELALLYNAPRSATITAKKRSSLWVLDRDTFNHIVKDSAMKKRNSYEAFLAKVDLLSDMDSYEKGKIADALKEENFLAG